MFVSTKFQLDIINETRKIGIAMSEVTLVLDDFFDSSGEAWFASFELVTIEPFDTS